jgi:hypothetical protein
VEELFDALDLNRFPALDGLRHLSGKSTGPIAFLVLMEHFKFPR